MRDEFIPYQYLEDALALLFDELPGLKSSSVAHKPGVGSGIQIGSRNVYVDSYDDFLEQVRLATVKLRLKSRIHYEVTYKWYRTNEHLETSDYGTGIGFKRFHSVRKEALEFLVEYLSGSQDQPTYFGEQTEEAETQLESGDRIVITGGAPDLLGVVAYFDKFLDEFKSRLICNYLNNGLRVNYIINTDEVRAIELKR